MRTRHSDICKTIVRGAAIVCIFLAYPAHAQLRLPSIPAPALPGQLPLNLDPDHAVGLPQRTLEQVTDLRELRLAHNRELLDRHGDRLEPDANGNPVVRGEILAFMPSAAAIEKAHALGFATVRETSTPNLDINTVVLRPPPGMPLLDALRRLRELAPQETFDLNHLYSEGGEIAAEEAVAAVKTHGPAAEAPHKAGLIDGGIDESVEALKQQHIHRHGCGERAFASVHGTAVASILVGKAAGFHGAAPDATLYAADVYCNDPAGGSLDAIVTAFGWMANERVPVINVSLVGPPNRILERVVASMVAHGYLIVAAVGNDGPAAPPLYPAAYSGVIGVTAVDAASRVLPEAGRGSQVAFAAPGADMAAANAGGGYINVRGTSFAAPVVAGLLAMQCDKPDAASAQRARAQLAASAADLGAKGKDPLYGDGLVGSDVRIAPMQVAAKALR